MRPPPQLTTPFSSSSCRAMASTIPSTHVSLSQYNSLLNRLDAEIQLRSHLEADLNAAREEIALLQHRLADSSATPHHTLSEPNNPSRSQVFRPSLTSTASQQPDLSQDHRQVPEVEGTPVQACDSNQPKGHDKEILSHCSDISASKSAARSAEVNSLKKSSQRKSSSNNLAAMNGAIKKSKTKKERATKVKVPGQSRYWTPEEHKLFLEALNKYGHKDLRKISEFVGTRNMTQVRTHSQKYFMRLMREAKRQNPMGKPLAAADEITTAADTANSSSDASLQHAAPQPVENGFGEEAAVVGKDSDGDKYSVPSTCGMTLLCLVGQDTLPV